MAPKPSAVIPVIVASWAKASFAVAVIALAAFSIASPMLPPARITTEPVVADPALALIRVGSEVMASVATIVMSVAALTVTVPPTVLTVRSCSTLAFRDSSVIAPSPVAMIVPCVPRLRTCPPPETVIAPVEPVIARSIVTDPVSPPALTVIVPVLAVVTPLVWTIFVVVAPVTPLDAARFRSIDSGSLIFRVLVLTVTLPPPAFV